MIRSKVRYADFSSFRERIRRRRQISDLQSVQHLASDFRGLSASPRRRHSSATQRRSAPLVPATAATSSRARLSDGANPGPSQSARAVRTSSLPCWIPLEHLAGTGYLRNETTKSLDILFWLGWSSRKATQAKRHGHGQL